MRATRVTVPALVLAALVAVAGPAYADGVTHTDRTGDMRSTPARGTSDTTQPAPDETNADITDVTVKHGRRQVTMRMQLAELTRAGDFVSVFLDLKAPHTRMYELYFTAASVDGRWRQGWTFTHGSSPVRCKGLEKSVDWAADTVTLAIPNSCLGKPAWVKAAPYTVTQHDKTIFVDEALRSGELRRQPAFSGRLFR